VVPLELQLLRARPSHSITQHRESINKSLCVVLRVLRVAVGEHKAFIEHVAWQESLGLTAGEAEDGDEEKEGEETGAVHALHCTTL
jgi:hypothetical protein